MTAPLRLGISPCPNDTFIFGAWVLGKLPGAPEVEVEFHDVQRLNELAGEEALDVSKISFGAWPSLAGRWLLLECGGALGMGCGPLLLRSPRAAGAGGGKVWLPGRLTTAARLFAWWRGRPDAGREVPAEVDFDRFDRIYRRLVDGEIEWGVAIHECRFTYGRDGLERAADLGDAWEKATGAAIPLGGIVLRGDLAERRDLVERTIRRSIVWAKEHRTELMPWMVKLAGIPDEAVVNAHVDTYVNAFSEELGEVGKRAVETFCAIAAPGDDGSKGAE